MTNLYMDTMLYIYNIDHSRKKGRASNLSHQTHGRFFFIHLYGLNRSDLFNMLPLEAGPTHHEQSTTLHHIPGSWV